MAAAWRCPFRTTSRPFAIARSGATEKALVRWCRSLPGSRRFPDVVRIWIPMLSKVPIPGCQAGARCLASTVRPRRTWPIMTLGLVIFFSFLRCSGRWNVIGDDGALCPVADRFMLSGAGCRWPTSGLCATRRRYRIGRAIIRTCMASDQHRTVSMSAATGFRFQACVRICQPPEPWRLCQISTD